MGHRAWGLSRQLAAGSRDGVMGRDGDAERKSEDRGQNFEFRNSNFEIKDRLLAPGYLSFCDFSGFNGFNDFNDLNGFNDLNNGQRTTDY